MDGYMVGVPRFGVGILVGGASSSYGWMQVLRVSESWCWPIDEWDLIPGQLAEVSSFLEWC